MARLKEQSRVERERRHLEKATKRKLEGEDSYMKRPRIEEPQVVTVSDNSDIELGEVEEDHEEKSDASADSPASSKRSRSVSRRSHEVCYFFLINCEQSVLH